MAMIKSVSVVIAATFLITLLALAAGAPLRVRRENTECSTENGCLSEVYTGLNLLFRLSVSDLLKNEFNTTLNISVFNQSPELISALTITCDLHYAQTELIPTFANSSDNVSMVVKVLNDANVDDSCLWLNETVSDGHVNCSKESIEKICKKWENIQQFNTTTENIESTLGSTVISTIEDTASQTLSWIDDHFQAIDTTRIQLTNTLDSLYY